MLKNYGLNINKVSEIPRSLWGIKEETILIVPHIVSNDPNTFDIRTMFACVLKAFMLSQHLDAVYMGELFSSCLSDTSLHESDVEGHDSMEWIRGQLKRDEVKVV